MLQGITAWGAAITPKPGAVLSEKELLNFAMPLIEEQSAYYHIHSSKVSGITETALEDGSIDIGFNLRLQLTLKASSVSELPFVKGMLNAVGIDSIEDVSSDAIEKNMSAQVLEVTTKIESSSAFNTQTIASVLAEELINAAQPYEEYIGAVTTVNYTLKVNATADGTIGPVQTLQFADFVPLEAHYPQTEAEMMNNGKAVLIESATRTLNALGQDQVMGTSPLYNRANARTYVNKWTSQATAAHKCEHGKTYIDKSKYNSSVYSIHCHNDCANYVSQAIYAGGIPDNSTWKKDTSAWISVSSLKSYFYDTKEYWYTSNYTTCNAGGIIINVRNGARSMSTWCQSMTLLREHTLPTIMIAKSKPTAVIIGGQRRLSITISIL